MLQSNDTDFRSMLRQELLDRCKRNSSYSSRAMARDLELSCAFFSQLLSGKRNLSEAKAYAIADRMGWSIRKKKLFAGLVRYETAKDPRVKAGILDELKPVARASGGSGQFTDLSVDAFRIVSDWYHSAISVLTELEGFRSDPAWIADRLGITPQEAKSAIERMLRLGLLERDRDGELARSQGNRAIGDVPSEAIQSFHRQFLRKAIEAQGKLTPDHGSAYGITMSVNPARLPKARQMIREFGRDLMTYLEGGKKRKVFHLTVQLFRVDRER